MGDAVTSEEVHEFSRRIRSRCEAIYGAGFRTPEYEHGTETLTRVQWYMAGRAAPMGPVPAEVAVAVFGTFNPRRVHAGLDDVWEVVRPEEMIERKLTSTLIALRRCIPEDAPGISRVIELLQHGLADGPVAGHPLFAALSRLEPPPSQLGKLFRLCNMIREHRSGAHVTAFRALALDPVEINVLNELWRNVPIGSIATIDMNWDPDDVAAALARLSDRGLAADGIITPEGRQLREEVERVTSAQQAPIISALGARATELIDLLDPWARSIAQQTPTT